MCMGHPQIEIQMEASTLKTGIVLKIKHAMIRNITRCAIDTKYFLFNFPGFILFQFSKSFKNVVVNSAARKQSHQTEMRKTLRIKRGTSRIEKGALLFSGIISFCYF